MLLYSTDKLPFGKYSGLEVGMIYLLAPSYINWMLADTQYTLGDIDFLTSLKTIDRFGKQGYLAHEVQIDREIFENYWSRYVNFEDIKFSGFRTFNFSSLALKKNEERQMRYGMTMDRAIVPESNREVKIFYPETGLKSERAEFTPIKYSNASKGSTTISFEVNNQKQPIDFLPQSARLKASSFYRSEWNISKNEIDSRIAKKVPFKGRIVEGLLMLEK